MLSIFVENQQINLEFIHVGYIVDKRMHEYFRNFILFFEGPIVS